MPRTYPVGYSCSITAHRTAAGPTVRLSFRPEQHSVTQVLEGLISYEALDDISALCFALLHEAQAVTDQTDPF